MRRVLQGGGCGVLPDGPEHYYYRTEDWDGYAFCSKLTNLIVIGTSHY